MVSVNNLSYFIGDRPIFEEASWHIKPKDKIGLIGLNGMGKTTLLKIINGDLTADAGDIVKANDCTIGYLNQDLLSYQSDESILAVAMQAFQEAMHLEVKIERILKKMEQDYSDKLVHELADAQEKYEALDGYTLQSKAEEILEGIGFKTQDLHRPLREFSGGWRMRVMLAKLLLEKPALLMLDEPTNHLDLPSIQWVENYLRNYSGAVIVVSHDRRFLDRTVESIVEVTGQKLVTYAGNYSFYLEEKTLRNEIQKNAFENQQQQIKQTEKFIERFRAKATKARQVQSRVKALERMDRVDDIVEENAAVNFRFSFRQQSGRQVVTLEDVSKSYGDLKIFSHTSTIIERGDKIALIGANGLGKSTLLRIISGKEPVDGKAQMGYNVVPAFYAQHQIEALNVNNEMLDELKQAGSGKTDQELRNVLGCFLFSNDDVFKKIKVLSGGEKSRVALAKTLISEANFLLLDEPTNHLDIVSVNILTQALQQYEGTLIVVSHDRQFISEVANKIWYIEDMQVKEYPGTLDEYMVWKSERDAAKAKGPVAPPPEKKAKNPGNKPDEQALVKKELSTCKKDLEAMETEIDQLENKKSAIEAQLAQPEVFGNVDKLQEVNQSFERVNSQLEKKQKAWEDLATRVDALEGEIQA